MLLNFSEAQLAAVVDFLRRTAQPNDFIFISREEEERRAIKYIQEKQQEEECRQMMVKQAAARITPAEEPAPAATAPAVQANRLRTNTLDPAIDKAIQQAGCSTLALVYLKLKELALAEEKPFTGIVDGNALCYTDDNGQACKLSKNALGKRLERRYVKCR